MTEEAPEDTTRFIRRISFKDNMLSTDVFGPYPDAEAAEAAVTAWGESTQIQLEQGLPFPECTFWAEGGATLFFVEPGQGNPGRML